MTVMPESQAPIQQAPMPSVPRLVEKTPRKRARRPDRLSINAAIAGDRRVEMVLAVLKGDMTIGDAAREAGVSDNTLNRDRALFIKAGREALSPRGHQGDTDTGTLVCSDLATHALGAVARERFELQSAAGTSAGN